MRADSADRLVVLGDLNTATTDRVFDPLTRVLGDAQADAGQGFGFTWPAELPVTRPDHVLHRGTDAGHRRGAAHPGQRPPRGDRRLPLVSAQCRPFSAGVTVSRCRLGSPLEKGQSRSAYATRSANCFRVSPAEEISACTSAR